jgi:saccharopine dehydrogenase-like NADP-dependent oxidoreductase
MEKNGKRILIVGGYGGVGRTIASILSDKLPGQVIVAGRSYRKARQFSDDLDGKAVPLQLDVSTAHLNGGLLEDVKLVVMCVDQQETAFVENCIQRGIDYVDITAGYDLLSQLERLDPGAKAHGATVVLSVGLAPGVTNLLARCARSQAIDAHHIDIFIMFGLEEDHGEASVRWTVENFNSEFQIHEAGGSRYVRSFLEGKRAKFPLGFGERTAFRFDFPEQHVLPESIGIVSASSWLCFDSALVTELIAFMSRTRLLKVLRSRILQNALVSVLSRYRVGSDVFILKAEARAVVDTNAPLFGCYMAGYGEGRATGIVVAKVALRSLGANFPPGVFHLEQLIDPSSFFEELGGECLQFAHH